MTEFTDRKSEFGSTADDIKAFNDAMNSLADHNNRFNLGKLLTVTIRDTIFKANNAQELVDAGATAKEAEEIVDWEREDKIPFNEEQQMNRSIVAVINDSIFDSVGLSVSPVRKNATLVGSDSVQSCGKVRAWLIDGDKFSHFLMAVNPTDTDEEFKHNVLVVVNDLLQETTDSVDIDSDDYQFAEQYIHGLNIIKGLKNIGLEESKTIRQLRLFSKYLDQGTFTEYVLAYKIGLFEPNGEGFGPSNWHRDATEEFLANKWNEVIAIIKKAKENPNGQDISEDLLNCAIEKLDYARQDWTQIKNSPNNNEKIHDYDNVYNIIGLELNMLSLQVEAEE